MEVCTERTGLGKLYPMGAYGLGTECRRTLIAAHFEEPWESDWCQGMCDNCEGGGRVEEVECGEWGRALITLAREAETKKQRVTGPKLLETWSKSVKKGRWEREHAEEILGVALLEGWLKEDFHFTPYSIISYIVPGPKAALNTQSLTLKVREESQGESEPKPKKSRKEVITL